MGQIKNINLLNDIKPLNIDRMLVAANEHKKLGNINFVIIEYNGDKVIIQVTQGKNAIAVYHSQKRLIEIVHETFDQFFIGKKVLVHPIMYNKSPADIVDKKWINKKMMENSIKLKDISKDTGINKMELRNLMNTESLLTSSVKALFYYYFLSHNQK